ncbi:hypothetical protein J6590_025489 [Homalodisca vitripennis]|nr:hypothetical protein J6590_025489 [Homalodisca vitripennis]
MALCQRKSGAARRESTPQRVAWTTRCGALGHWHIASSTSDRDREPPSLSFSSFLLSTTTPAVRLPVSRPQLEHLLSQLSESIKSISSPKALKARLTRFLPSQAFYSADEFMAYDWFSPTQDATRKVLLAYCSWQLPKLDRRSDDVPVPAFRWCSVSCDWDRHKTADCYQLIN